MWPTFLLIWVYVCIEEVVWVVSKGSVWCVLCVGIRSQLNDSVRAGGNYVYTYRMHEYVITLRLEFIIGCGVNM